MVRNQFALLGQSRTVDAVRLKQDYRQVRTDRHNHQRKEQIVASCQFCDEEDARERRMHHARHHASHTHQGKILLRNIDAYLIDVP